MLKRIKNSVLGKLVVVLSVISLAANGMLNTNIHLRKAEANVPAITEGQATNDMVPVEDMKNVKLPKDFDKKIISKASVKDDFVENTILVAFNRANSTKNRKISPSKFEGIKVKQVKDLTYFSGDEKAKKWVAEGTNEDDFCQLVKITLDKSDKQYVLDCIKEIEKRDDVWFACPDYLIEDDYDEVTNDPYYTSSGQYGLKNAYTGGAWRYTTGSRNVRVGVLDSGVNSGHEDLAANMASGWNFADNNSDTSDISGHGTHVAGIIGAVGNNAKGIAGVNWNVSIVPLKRDASFRNPISSTVDAVNYATNNNIPIINMSFGTPTYSRYVPLLPALIAYPGLAVCSAGNESVDNDTLPSYPSSFGLANMISVASTDANDNMSSFSNYGLYSVDIAAPGNEIYSTLTPNANSYGMMSGTSMAAPQVSGVAALIKAEYPNLTTAQIKEAILNSVDKLPSLSGKVKSNGRLNASKAMVYCQKFSTSSPVEGVYRIRNVKSGLYLEATGGGVYGNDAEQRAPNGGTSQLWQITRTTSGSYAILSISNPDNGLNIHSGVSAPRGGRVIMWPFSQSVLDPASRFRISYAGKTTVNGQSENKYALLSECTSFQWSVGVQNGLTTPAAKCITDVYNANSDSEHWVFERYLDCVEEGAYFVKNMNSHYYLDMPNGVTTNGTQIVQYGFHGGTNQQFQIKHLGNWIYSIRSISSPTRSAVEVRNGSTAENERVQLYDIPNDFHSTVQWKIMPIGNGAYRVYSYCTNFQKLMAIQNASTSMSGVTIQKTPSSSKAENWAFEIR